MLHLEAQDVNDVQNVRLYEVDEGALAPNSQPPKPVALVNYLNLLTEVLCVGFSKFLESGQELLT